MSNTSGIVLCKRHENTPNADIDSNHNLLVTEVQTRLKAIKKLGRGNQNGIWKKTRVKKVMPKKSKHSVK